MSREKVEKYLDKNDFEYKNIIELSGDISTRKYFEVEINKEVRIACLNDKENKKHNELYLYWYEQYLKHQIKVPKIIHFEDGFNVQEKIDQTIFDKLKHQTDKTSDIYNECLKILLKIHNIEIDQNQKYEKLNLERFRNEFSLSYTAFDFQEYEEVIDELVLKSLSFKNEVICHRDFHSRNILIQKDVIYIIDFQDSMLGNGIYDVVSIVNDCYIQLPSEVIENFKKNYFLEKKPYSSEEEFLRQCDLYTIQRVFKAFGNFKTFFKKHNDPYYLKFIKPNALKILDIIERNKELNDLKPIFKRLRDEY